MKTFLLSATIALALSACGTMNLSESPIVSSSDGRNREAVIENDSDWQIYSVHALNIETGKWTANILGDDRLHRHSDRTVRIDDGSGECMYIFRALLSKGQKVRSDPIDVCRLGSWRIF